MSSALEEVKRGAGVTRELNVAVLRELEAAEAGVELNVEDKLDKPVMQRRNATAAWPKVFGDLLVLNGMPPETTLAQLASMPGVLSSEAMANLAKPWSRTTPDQGAGLSVTDITEKSRRRRLEGRSTDCASDQYKVGEVPVSARNATEEYEFEEYIREFIVQAEFAAKLREPLLDKAK